jgi:hypothetical protein
MSIYVISNEINSKNNLYKIGRTKDTNTVIVTKYQRYLPCARVFLWYPSEDCIKDERTLLKLFKQYRGRTPNETENEWLKIEFSELKSKIDEYFGFDGKAFEEEQKLERERKRIEKENREIQRKIEKENQMNTCEYCNRIYSCTKSLKRHHNTCKEKQSTDIQQQLNSLTEKIQTQQQQHEQKIQILKSQYEKKIKDQQLRIEKLEGQIFEIAKISKLNHNQ